MSLRVITVVRKSRLRGRKVGSQVKGEDLLSGGKERSLRGRGERKVH